MTRSARRTVLAAAGAGRCADTGRAAGGTGRRRWRRAAGIRRSSRRMSSNSSAPCGEQGISQSTLDRAFAQIHFVDRVIKADRNQPEQKVTDDYLRRVMSPAKVRRGANCTGSASAMDARQRALSGAGALYHRAVGHGKRLR